MLTYSNEESKKFQALYNEGRTDCYITRKLNISVRKIVRWRQDHNLSPNRNTNVSFLKVLTTDQIPVMTRFLAMLDDGARKCAERGIKPDVMGFIIEYHQLYAGCDYEEYDQERMLG